MSLEALTHAIAGALRVPASNLEVQPGGSGGNSRIYIVALEGRKLVAKQYFRHPSDARDRLHAEWSFLEYAVGAGIRCVPTPIARDPAAGVGIYEYIAGRNLGPADVSAARVQEAAAFFLALNKTPKVLPTASEACFSIVEHLRMVDARVDRLAAIPQSSEEDIAASAFVKTLDEQWRVVRGRIRGATHDPAAEVEERCISPSDFGFHNALARQTGELCFLDFEYAGWDDPAKMAGDFFSHPGVPVPREHFDSFVKSTMSFSRHANALEARARLLEPLFRIKWCCIVLNEFIPEAAQRRRFALPEADLGAVKRRQLDKARNLLASVTH